MKQIDIGHCGVHNNNRTKPKELSEIKVITVALDTVEFTGTAAAKIHCQRR